MSAVDARPTPGAPGAPPATGNAAKARVWWQARTARERQLVTLVGLLLVAFVVWSLLIQPALRTLRDAPVRIDRLDAQLQQMQRVAAESRSLRDAPRVSPQQATQALRAATDRLGTPGKLALQGDRATLTLTNASAEALRAWLAEARSGARARPLEAQLQRGPTGYTGTLVVLVGGSS